MAFHKININLTDFELAPKKVKSKWGSSSTNENLFIPYLSNGPGPGIVQYGSNETDYVAAEILVANNSRALDNPRFFYNPSQNAVGATKFIGDLDGNATSATNATNATNVNVAAASTTNASYYIQFVNGTSGNKKSYTDTNLKYNPYTNTLTTTTFSGNLSGTATNATYIKVATANTTNASYYIQFVNGTSGNKKSYIDTNLKYNPYTNTLTTTNFAGTATYIHVAAASNIDASYYIQFVNGTSGNKKSYTDTNLKYNPKNNVLTVGQVNGKLNGPVQTTTTSTNASYYISFVNDSGTSGMRYSYVNASLYYNPSTTTLTAPKIKYTSTAQQWIGGKTLTNNAFYPSNNFTTTAFFPILAAKTSGENVISLGGLGDQYGFFGYKKDTTANQTDWHFKWDSNNGNTYVTGKIYGTATHADSINVYAATANATYYVSFVNGTSGARIPYTDGGLYYNPSTNELSAGGGFFERSDERLKDFQEDIEVNFSYLHNITKKYYYWKDDTTYTRHIGTSAQEVQKYYPELVNIDDNGYLTMNYDKLSVVALKAIDVLHEEVTELKKENAELKERLARLEELILNK